ncbi:hypothetical protein C2857_002359 [Epichloe festucae Fl1]|uniref:tRNA (guanine(9)-N1)-methyltransferase n=1 Tax=Epichloe festucae (strain Fl1) TaxID=877507 RepID=A0A7S9KK74_EPIFF|nr:hypothetical protein C2857_002359 [Epichloe festucae Fl1]
MSSTAADHALAIPANEAEASQPPTDAAASSTAALAVAVAVAAGTTATATATGPNAGEAEAPNMSKNALKRLRRMQEWENGREDRKRRRREKRTATKARRRGERAADPANALFAARKPRAPAQLVPVSIILDCDFDEYMTDKERVSMSGQVTRCYSENRKHKYKAHFWISGWGGRMKERFETAMESQHTHWKGVGFEEGDFLAAAVRARGAMRSDKGGELVDSLRRSAGGEEAEGRRRRRRRRGDKEPFPLAGPLPELDDQYGDVVYLTSESPYTLERLEPNTSYIIGGLVDKNREKGLCYRRAVERGVRTARLPIGQYMVMQSRQILATNHVVEIMVKWLECEDWGTAFAQVIPKRKGGKLIGQEDGETATVETGAAVGGKDDDDDDDDHDDHDDHGQSEIEGGEADRAREADTAQ